MVDIFGTNKGLKLKQVKCGYCGNDFEQTHTSQKYCIGCRKDARKMVVFQNRIKWQYEAGLDKKKCKVCGSEFNSIGSKSSGTKKVFCSKECVEEQNRIRNRENKRNERKKAHHN